MCNDRLIYLIPRAHQAQQPTTDVVTKNAISSQLSSCRPQFSTQALKAEHNTPSQQKQLTLTSNVSASTIEYPVF